MEPDQAPDFRLQEQDTLSSHDSINGQHTLINQVDDEAPATNLQGSHKFPEIEWRYLTFDTEVPVTPTLPSSKKADLPPCPNLRRYDDPFQWSLPRKRFVTYLACAANIIAAYASGAYAFPERQLMAKWGINHVVYSLGIFMFTVGFGITPMFLAPLSEMNGRRPVFIGSGLLFVLTTLTCGLTDSFAGMLLSRFFLGVGGSTFSTMGGGILADIWVTSERNTAMTLFTGATLFGTGLGPLCSGIVAEKLLWRWVFYIQVFTTSFVVALIITFFRETRGSIVLSQKAKVINKWYEAIEEAGAVVRSVPPTSPPCATSFSDPEKHDSTPTTCATSSTVHKIRYKVLADEQRASILKLISLSIYRPFHLLFTEPVVFWFSVWLSFAWSILYLQFGSIPLVFQISYNFTIAQSGYVFAAMSIGGILASIIGIAQEHWAVKRYPHKFNDPEGRLLFTCVESALVPIGMFWFGWSCYPSVHWIMPTIAVGIATMGICSVFLAVFNYTADVYRSYASSALAASGICRNLMAGSFPLVTHALFKSLGFQAASSLLGGIAAVLTLVPWVLVRWGPAIRARSKIASAFLEEQNQ